MRRDLMFGDTLVDALCDEAEDLRRANELRAVEDAAERRHIAKLEEERAEYERALGPVLSPRFR